jgi:hypothetical protein
MNTPTTGTTTSNNLLVLPGGNPRSCRSCLFYAFSPMNEMCTMFGEPVYDQYDADDCDLYEEAP